MNSLKFEAVTFANLARYDNYCLYFDDTANVVFGCNWF